MPPVPGDVPLGALVQVNAGRGRVRYCGAVQFAPGKWVGVELSQPNGKNDGSVQGQSYFVCEPNYGVFVRSSQLLLLEEPAVQAPISRSTSRPTSRTAAPPPSALRPVHAPRSSISASTPPTRLAGPGPSLTRTLSNQSITRSSSGLSTASRPTSTAAVGALPKPARTSSSSSLASLARATSPAKPVVRPAGTAPRPAPISRLSGPTTSSRRLAFQTPTRAYGSSTSPSEVAHPPTLPTQITEESLTSIRPPDDDPDDDDPLPVQQPQAPARPERAPVLRRVSESPVAERERLPLDHLQSPTSPVVVRSASPAPHLHELEELRVKVRVLEVKRADDSGRIRELENRLSEAEQFVALRPKLQAKLTSQQTEIVELRRTVKDLNVEKDSLEGRMLELSDQMEMSLLDKEVAEERAEVAEAEMEALKEQLAESEVERDVLKEEKAMFETPDGPVPDDVTRSLAYIQMERHNERLKEALLKLRDIAQESEREQRKKINELEKEVASVEDLQSQYEMALSKLDNAEAQIEDLKQQLDASLGAEDMVMQLTERVMSLSEELAEKEIMIEDLETLKELNEELEETHLETEKQLQEELDMKTSELRAAIARVEDQQDQIMEYENTVQQFRDAVLTLQADIEYLRNQQTTQQTEAQTLNSQSQAILALNMKLQSTVAKNQAKNIDLELRRLDATQAKEHLQIVQLFLPQAYFEADSDATACYLFFSRLAYKADLINAVVAQKHNLPESLMEAISDSLVGVCEMRGRIAHLSALCKRFVAVLKRCDPDTFIKAGTIFPEIATMEKRLDMHIERLRREEFKEEDCVSDVSKMLAQFEHLAETFFSGFHFALGEQELDLALSLDYDLDTFMASLSLVQHVVSTGIQDPEIVFEAEDLDLSLIIVEPLNSVLAQARSTRTAVRKIIARIQDLVNDKAALRPNLIPTLGALTEHMSKIIDFGIQLAQRISVHLAEIRATKEPLRLPVILLMIRNAASESLGKRDASWEAVAETLNDLSSEAASFLPVTLEADSILRITGNAPWISRVDEIRAKAAVNLEAEREVAILKEEARDLQRFLKAKDQSIQEAGVKMELMDRRMESLKKQAEVIAHLEAELGKLRKSEASYQESLEQIQAELDAAEQENAKLKANGGFGERSFTLGDGDALVQEGTLETSQLLEQIEALKGALRFLRSENSYLKGQGFLSELNSLPPLEPIPGLGITTGPSTTMPSLVADSSADSDTESDRPLTPPSVRTLAEATKHLYSDILMRAASAKVIDISKVKPDDGRRWKRRKDTPEYQLAERRRERDVLERKVRGLVQQASVRLSAI